MADQLPDSLSERQVLADLTTEAVCKLFQRVETLEERVAELEG